MTLKSENGAPLPDNNPEGIKAGDRIYRKSDHWMGPKREVDSIGDEFASVNNFKKLKNGKFAKKPTKSTEDISDLTKVPPEPDSAMFVG